MTSIRWKAYCLATVRRECGLNYAPIRELGDSTYFSIYEKGKLALQLGNTSPGDGFQYRGRGYVQLTGRSNYVKLSKVVGFDLSADPDKALDPMVAYKIMSFGMRHGIFTGVGLSKFINADICDYINARRIINGLDHASEIAVDAQKFEVLLFKHRI